MTAQSEKRKPASAEASGPVKPGSPLYRALELIAREIAKDLEAKSAPRSKPGLKP